MVLLSIYWNVKNVKKKTRSGANGFFRLSSFYWRYHTIISEDRRFDELSPRKTIAIEKIFRNGPLFSQIKNTAHDQADLNDLLKNSPKNDRRSVSWTSGTIKALKRTKTALAKVALLAYSIGSAQFVLTSDASDVAIGATLEQLVNGKLQPLTFYSSKLNSAQREVKYNAYDRKVFAVYKAVDKAIKHFRHFIEGRLIKIRTDHKPLTFVFHQKLKKASPRQAWHLDFIDQFSTDIEYISREENVAADAFFRIAAVKCLVIFTTEELAEEQHKDVEIQRILAGKDMKT